MIARAYILVASLFVAIVQQPLTLDAASQNTSRRAFDNLLEKAKTESPELGAARNRKSLSEFSVSQRSLFWTPNVSGTLTREVSGERLEQSSVQFDMNLFRFGSDIAALRAARAESRVRTLQFKSQELEVEKAISELLFNYLLIRSEINYQVRVLGIKEQTLKIAQERFRRGQLPEQEVLRARLDWEQTQAGLLDRQLQLKNSEDKILVSVGSENLKELDWPWIDFVRDTKGLQEVLQRKGPQESLQSLILQDQKVSSDQKYWSSKLGYLPSLNLLSSSSNDRWSSALTLSIPLWDKMASYLQVRSHLLESQTLAEELRFSRRSFEVQQDSLSERLELSRKSAEKALDGSNSVKKLFEDSLRRFQAGRSSVNDLFLDENRYLLAETAAQQALASYHRQMIEACHSRNESVLNCF